MVDRLVAFDALNIIRQVWEANPEPSSDRKLEKTVASCLATFRRALRSHTPTHQVAVFDHGGETWRHRLYEGYRRSRVPMPESLREGLPTFRAALKTTLGLPSLSIADVEADDVLATLCMRWIERDLGDAPWIVSTDKDLCQMLAYGARQWHPFNNAELDESWVRAKFGVPPHLVGDCLALWGDTSDDIPGVRGIGPKSAAPLLIEHGGLEPLLAAAAHVPGKLGERLVLGADIARLSRQLVRLDTGVTCQVRWSDLRALATAPTLARADSASASALQPSLSGW